MKSFKDAAVDAAEAPGGYPPKPWHFRTEVLQHPGGVGGYFNGGTTPACRNALRRAGTGFARGAPFVLAFLVMEW